jgi:hypothetical protein
MNPMYGERLFLTSHSLALYRGIHHWGQGRMLGMRRQGLGAAAAALVVLVIATIVIAGLVVSEFPGPHKSDTSATSSSPISAVAATVTSGPKAPTTTTTMTTPTVSRPSSQTTSSTQSSSQVATTTTTVSGARSCPGEPGFSYASANITFTVPPCTSYTFPGPEAQIAVLNTSQVLPYVDGAYWYGVAFVKGNFASTADVILNVTGKLEVAGNWTTGYGLSFVGNKLLNITVQKESTLVVSNLLVDNLSDRHTSIKFNQQQQKIIQVALSNSTVQGLMTDPPYYVDVVFPEPGGLNTTNSVQLLQVNGLREINVRVNDQVTAVVSAAAVGRGEVDCSASGVCVTVPWNVKPDAGVALPPFLLTIEYSGQWTANVTAYNNSTPSPKFLLYTKTFAGTGDGNITIPWQSVVDGMTVTATVQKSDAGTSTLTATINWMGSDNPTKRSTEINGTSVTVSSSVLA